MEERGEGDREDEQWRRRSEELQAQMLQLQGDNQELQSRLKGNHAQEGWFECRLLETHDHKHTDTEPNTLPLHENTDRQTD